MLHAPRWKAIHTIGGQWWPSTDVTIINKEAAREIAFRHGISSKRATKTIVFHENIHRCFVGTTYRYIITEMERFGNVLVTAKTQKKEYKYWLLFSEIALHNAIEIWRNILEPFCLRLLELEIEKEIPRSLLEDLSHSVNDNDVALRNYKKLVKVFSRKVFMKGYEDPFEAMMLILSCMSISHVKFSERNNDLGPFLSNPPLSLNPQRRLDKFLYHFERFEGDFQSFLEKVDSISGLKEYRVIPKGTLLLEPTKTPSLDFQYTSKGVIPQIQLGPLFAFRDKGKLVWLIEKRTKEIGEMLALWAFTEIKEEALTGEPILCPLRGNGLCNCTEGSCFMKNWISRTERQVVSLRKVKMSKEQIRLIPPEIRESYMNGPLFEQ